MEQEVLQITPSPMRLNGLIVTFAAIKIPIPRVRVLANVARGCMAFIIATFLDSRKEKTSSLFLLSPIEMNAEYAEQFFESE